MFTLDPNGPYYYRNGWNRRALVAVALAAVFAVATVWVEQLEKLEGFAWIIGALLGGVFYYAVMRSQRAASASASEVAERELTA